MQLSFDGWKALVEDYDPVYEYSEYLIFMLHIKACYLSKFFKLCLEYYNTITQIIDIASLSILSVNKTFGLFDDDDLDNSRLFYINNPKTLLKWFRSYRCSNSFANHFPKSKTHRLPPLLSENLDLVTDLNNYCKENISRLGVEMVYQYIHNVLIPNLVSKIKLFVLFLNIRKQ